MRAALIYPHQLFPAHPALCDAEVCVLVEEPLLMAHYRFHRQKLIRLDEHGRTTAEFLARLHGDE